jgi:hypothetical protein
MATAKAFAVAATVTLIMMAFYTSTELAMAPF